MPTHKQPIDFLHEFFPIRARRLASEIERRSSIEPWLRSLLVKFIETLILNATELEQAYRDQRISALAWTARNILELSVWIDYCLLSASNAQRFRDDAMRDAAGWAAAIQAGHRDAEGHEHVDLRRAQQNLAEFVNREFSILNLDDDYKSVS